MSVIDIKEFGGELPSTSPRNLPGKTGQAAKNLTNSTNEFLPLGNPLVIATTESVVNTAAAVSNPKVLFRTAFMPNGAPNTSLSAGWLTGAGEANFVRGQINGVTTERTYYTDSTGPRKFAWQGGVLVDRPMGVPAPLAAPAVSHVVVDEFRTSELADAGKNSRTLLANTLFAVGSPGYDGSDFSYSAPTASSFGWVAHPTDPARRLLRVPFVGGALLSGFEFLQEPFYGGAKVTDGGVDYWQMDWRVHGTTWVVDAPGLKAALMALPDPAVAGRNLMTEADADIAVAKAMAHFAADVSPRKELIADAKERTRAVQRALQSIQDGSLNAAFYASSAYKDGLRALIGEGTTVAGTVTQAILDYCYITTSNTAWGEPGNVSGVFISGATRYWQPDFASYGGYTPDEGRGLIRADLVANIKTHPNGVKWFDYNAMAAILRAEFKTIIDRRSPESQNFYRPKVEGWITEWLAPLKAFFDPQSQASLSAGIVGGSNLAVGFASLVDQAGAALQRITDNFAALRAGVSEVARTIYEDPAVTTLAAQQDAAVVPIIDTRFYIATYVTDWGEESAPSAVSVMMEVDQNDTVDVSVAPPPAGYGYITKFRLYRSNVGSETAAFQFCHEGSVSAVGPSAPNLTHSDGKASAELGEPCPTLTWLQPEVTMSGLVGLPNGIMAGHFGNTVAFSEPFVPYAWPIEYQLTVESPVVGLGVFGQTVFVGTTGSPYFISGSDSASMSALKLESSQACVSRRSIVALEGGVIYASPDGLCLADGSGVKLITRGMWNYKDWQALQPATIFASSHEGAYVFACNCGTRVFILGDGKLTEVDVDELGVSALYSDKGTGTLCSASGEFVVASFRGAGRRTGRWKTPLITLPAQQPMAWAKVYGEQNATLPATVRWYGDGELRHTMTFTDLNPQRLPPGRWLEHEVEVESKARITRVVLASTLEELKEV